MARHELAAVGTHQSDRRAISRPKQRQARTTRAVDGNRTQPLGGAQGAALKATEVISVRAASCAAPFEIGTVAAPARA